VAARARASSFGAILFTLLRCNSQPEITVAYDVDANAAAAQNSLRAEASNFGSRRTFALSGVGHLRAADQGYAWVPVDYRWREPKVHSNYFSNDDSCDRTTIQANFKLMMVAIAPQPFEQTSNHKL